MKWKRNLERFTFSELRVSSCKSKTVAKKHPHFDSWFSTILLLFHVPRLFTAQSKLCFSSFVHELEIRQLKVLTFFFALHQTNCTFKNLPSDWNSETHQQSQRNFTFVQKSKVWANPHLFHLFSDKCKCAWTFCKKKSTAKKLLATAVL